MLRMTTPSSRPRVLVVDDETLIADTLALILNQGGFDARAAYTCRVALDDAIEFRPHLLISDVLMSDMNGVDAAVRMHELLPELRVFLLSGQMATREMIQKSTARDLGFEVLVKPVHPQELLRKLRVAALETRSVA